MLYQTILFALLSCVVAQESASKLKCTENEIVNECGGCDRTCENPDPICPAICGPPQCRCKEGLVRAANKTCIAQTTCAPAARSRRDSPPACAENEEYHACGACDGTCKEPDVACTADCRPGQCGCKAGFVRDAGKCIKKEACKKTRAARQANPCASMTCPQNTRCDWHPIMCFRAPCPQPEAKCVPLDS
ncbi:SWM-1 protein [Aphelenchoides avenae]|nr:SWM-1 protein [Aphelenchus avenae]